MNTIFSPIKTALSIFILTISMLSASKVVANELTIAFFDQPEARAKSQMLRHILEINTDYTVTLKETSLEDMWKGIAEGRYDGSVSIMLPYQADLLKQYADDVEDLGPNWIGSEYSIHTIVRKNYEKDDLHIVRFLNNYCLCGERLSSTMALIKNDDISREDATVWIAKHEAWITNMMGFVRPYDDREARMVTY